MTLTGWRLLAGSGHQPLPQGAEPHESSGLVSIAGWIRCKTCFGTSTLLGSLARHSDSANSVCR